MRNRFLTIISSLSLFLQAFSPFAQLVPSVKASEPITSNISFNNSKNTFTISLNTSETVNYVLSYYTGSQIEGAQGSGSDNSGNFTRDIYAGIKSGPDSRTDTVVRGIFKSQVGTEFLNEKEFNIDHGNLVIVYDGSTPSLDLSDAENYWLEHGTDLNPTPTVTPTPTATPTPTVVENGQVLGAGFMTPKTDGHVNTTVVQSYSCRADSLNGCLTTNQSDYSPSSVAIITGYGFAPDTQYTLVISTDGLSQSYTILTDDKGSFTYSYTLYTEVHKLYTVQLKDLNGQVVATTTFTDSPPSISITTINGTSSPFNFVCPDNPLFSPVTLSGSGSGTAPPGQIQQYHVQIDWGDGTVDNGLGTFTPNSGQGNFTFTFSDGPHAYSAGGSFTIKARLYHSQPPGNDNQADVVASVTVCIVTSSISGQKFNDVNGNGVKDGGETGLSGWTIYLDTNNNGVKDGGEPSTTTDGSGNYSFTNLSAGTYHVREVIQAGWQQTLPGSGGSFKYDVTLSSGQNVTGKNFGNQQLGTMIVKKVMVGGTDSFTFTGDVAGTISSNNGTLTVNSVAPGTYTSVESAKSGWDLTNITCDDGQSANVSTGDTGTRTATFNIEAGETVTCTFTNSKLPTLTVDKVLSPSQDPGKFNLQIDGQTAGTGANVGNGGTTGAQIESIGSHTVGETAGTNTSLSDYTSVISGDCDSQGNVTLSAGQNKVCTITNTRNTGTIIVDKQVDTNGDGTYDVTTDAGANALGFQWGLDLESPARNFGDSLAVTTNVTHSISEAKPAGYHFVTSIISTEPSSCNGLTPNPQNYPVPFLIPNPGGNTRHILLCNARDTGTLTVNKILSPDTDPGTFDLLIDQTIYKYDVTNGGTTGAVTLTSGPHTVSELGTNGTNLSDYNTSFSGACDSQGNVTIALGDNKTCTITNTRKQGTIGFRKLVVGSNEPASSWTFTISGVNGTFQSGDSIALNTNTYTITESGPSGYTASVSGACSNVNGNSATLTVTEQGGTCTFTNTRDTGKISGIKFDDINGDGQFDPDTEDILAGWTIKLYKDNDGDLGDLVDTKVTTNPDGYLFNNVPTGPYFVCEELQNGWMQTLPVSNGGCYQVNLTQNGQLLTDEDFGNFKLASISGHKFNDLNGNGTWDDGEPALSDWTFQLQKYGEGWSTIGTAVTDSGGNWSFGNLGPGKYRVHEVLKSGWHPTTYTSGYYPSSSGIYVFSVANFNNKDFGNHQNKLTIYKYDQHKQPLGGATFRICPVEGQCFDVTDNGNGDANNQSGIVEIDGLADNYYTVTEIQAPQGYQLDNSTCEKDINGESTDVSCSFFNERLNPVLIISKSNDATGDKHPGDSVVYTITVQAQNNTVYNAFVIDLLPAGFKYRHGSWSANSLLHGLLAVAEPGYASPGTWNLGTIDAGDTITLQYTVDIDGGQQLGLYKDVAWGVGTQASDPSSTKLLALAQPTGFVSTNFVGTQVNLVGESQQTASVNLQGQVLGVTTALPATGGQTIWMILVTLLSVLGGLLVLLGLILKKKIKFGKLFVILAFAFLFVLKPQSALASGLSIRMEQPKSPTFQNTFNITFVVLDNSGSGNPISVQCFKKGPSDGGFSAFGGAISISAGGNTGNCSVDGSIVSTEGTYLFYAQATTVTDSASSADEGLISVDYKTSGPGTPTNYVKQQIGTCTFRITFQTANDGGKTFKVELYRSSNTSFTADAGTRVDTLYIGSKQSGQFTNSPPDCNNTWYYVIRAFDNAGNGSGIIGDTGVTTVVTTGVSPAAGGAIPVTGVALPGAGAAAGAVLGEKAGTQAGEVLGATPSATPEVVTVTTKPTGGLLDVILHRKKLTLGILALILIILTGGYYAFFKKRE